MDCVVFEQFDNMAGGITETGEPYSPFVSVSTEATSLSRSFKMTEKE